MPIFYALAVFAEPQFRYYDYTGLELVHFAGPRTRFNGRSDC
jgi:hypothetical protein